MHEMKVRGNEEPKGLQSLLAKRLEWWEHQHLGQGWRREAGLQGKVGNPCGHIGFESQEAVKGIPLSSLKGSELTEGVLRAVGC